MRAVWLALALMPYATLAVVDTWLHEKSRRVPRVEQLLHAGLGVSLITFLVGVFSARTVLAIIALAVFAALACADEFGFHRGLARRERRVHVASYSALVVFVCAWQFLGTAP